MPSGRDDAGALVDGDDLVGLHLLELFQFLCGRPFHFDEIDSLILSEAEMETQIALRHDARAAVHLVHLDMLAGDNTNASADGRAIAFRAKQFNFDPVLLIATIVA